MNWRKNNWKSNGGGKPINGSAFGGLVKGLRIEDFGKRSILRNPLIGEMLHRAGYIEKMGTGISKMRNLMKNAGLMEPVFDFNGFFSVKFMRPGRGNVPVISRQKFIFELIGKKGKITTKDVLSYLKVSEKTVKRDFAYLRKNGLVKRAGSDKKGYYVLAAGQQNIHAGKSPSRRQKGGAE